jgi:hypothetical protein
MSATLAEDCAALNTSWLGKYLYIMEEKKRANCNPLGYLSPGTTVKRFG